MIHKFTISGKNFVLDVNTGSLYELDDSAFDLIGEEALLGKDADIQELIDSGKLYSPDDFAGIPDENFRSDALVKAICLHVAHDCNLRCEYCFAGKGDYNGQRSLMPVDVAKKAIDFVIANSGSRRNIEVDFFGGEPLMNFDVVRETVKYGDGQGEKHGKNFRWTITTNGVLLDDDKLDFINEHMDNLVLSLDGRKEVNDRMRRTVSGMGSYDVISEKLLCAAKSREDKDYYVRGTFTKKNLDFAEDVLHLANMGFRNISVEPVIGDEDYAIGNADLPVIFKEYERLARLYLSGDFNFFHFNISDGGPCVIKRLTGCGAGCEYVAISPDGEIYPCHQFMGRFDFLLGNVVDGIVRKDISREFAKTNVYSQEKCKKCWAKFYCSGGCHASQTDVACELMKKRIECALYVRARKLA